MPYQLIYTSAAHLLDSPLSGYGVVARSENMPAALVRTLIECSEYKEPADQGILGPQFSYRVEECLNTLYHIFTSVRPAGADHSKRSCHIAHHLILRAEEMHALCRGAGAPTPAGILLSLELCRYWVHHWQKEPEYLAENTLPKLTETPSSSNFPTWLIFTGNSENAHIFQTPPFHRGCLVIVPQKTQSRDLLRLLHESYTLSPTLGWGIPFCTYSVEADKLESTQRLFTTAGSALCARAQRLGFPMLDLKPGFKYIPPSGFAPPSSTAAPTRPISTRARRTPPPPPPPVQAAAPAPAPAPTLSSLPALPYHYEEDRSNDTFELPWHKEKRVLPVRRFIRLGIALVCLCALGLALHRATRPAPVKPQPAAEAHQPTTEQPPTADTTPAVATPTTAAEADDPPTPDPWAPDPEDTDTTTAGTDEPPAPDPWAPDPEDTDTTTDATDDTDGTDDTPDDASATTDDTDTTPDDADGAEPGEEEEPQQPRIVHEYGMTIPTLTGAEVEKNLLALLETGSARLEHGKYAVYVCKGKGKRKEKELLVSFDEHVLDMQKQEGYVQIQRSANNPGEYRITAGDKSMPEVTLQLEGSKLAGLSVAGNTDVVVQLPVVNPRTNKIQRLLLLPRLRISLTPANPQPVPVAPHAESKDPVFDFNLLQPNKYDKLNKEKYDEWVKKNPSLHELSCPVALAVQPVLYLPQPDGRAAEIRIAPPEAHSSFTCRMNGKKPELLHQFNLKGELRKSFENELKSYKGGGTLEISSSLANVCEVVLKISKAKGSPDDKLMTRYEDLYKSDEMADVLKNDIFTSDQSRLLKFPSKEKDWKLARKDIQKKLGDKSSKKYLLRDLETYLSKLMKDLRDELWTRFANESENAPKHYLQLMRVRTGKDQPLIWEFELVQAPQS